MKTQTIEGTVKENPWGDWSDVDKGWYVGMEDIQSLFRQFEGKKIRLLIEEIKE